MSGPDPRPALALLVLAAALAASTPAHAVLGENLASVHADQQRMSAVRRQQQLPAMQVHLLTLPDGSTVREYAGADGRVFAISWATRTKPRLDRLLGTHFAAYAEAGRRWQQQGPRAGITHASRLASGDLVVESQGQGQAFVGRAWLVSRVPAGTDARALR